MFQNIVVGSPLVEPAQVLAFSIDDWKTNEESKTLFTNERWLPAIMKQAGIVGSTSEVRRNRPDLVISLNYPDCFWVKWGKKRAYVVVGKQQIKVRFGEELKVLTRRQIIFKDPAQDMLWATPEFNGDKREFEIFGMGDTCSANWDEILLCFEKVKTIEQFKKANKQAQRFYFSNMTGRSKVFPIKQINSIDEVVNDRVYLIEKGEVTLFKTF